VRAASGVCIADEVQVGFGRLGTHFWGFETQGVVPDIVVLGKPIGNGFPLAAVITTEEIAAQFDNGMEFFSTFGGNPVACAAGLAVLDVLEDECLQERALRVGSHLRAGLRGLQARHRVVGKVRVQDCSSATAAFSPAPTGPHDNVLKIRPPLVLAEADADLFVSTLDDILDEDSIRPRRE
jgi:4-aminobutyrate aminotransferase-like enzyme